MSETAALTRPRTAGLEEQFIGLAPDLLENVSPEDLHRAFMNAMRPRPVTSVGLQHVTEVTASVTRAIEELLDALPVRGSRTFRELTEHVSGDVMEVVVRFLAVLELFKQGTVGIDQVGRFGDLTVEWIGPDGDRAAAVTGIDIYEG